MYNLYYVIIQIVTYFIHFQGNAGCCGGNQNGKGCCMMTGASNGKTNGLNGVSSLQYCKITKVKLIL